MKLRNLLFGTMIACAFASCSNEDDPIVNVGQGEEAEGPATLSVKIDKVQTKAADTDITTLSVLIFKGATDNGVKLEKIGEINTNALEVTKIPVTSGNKKVLVLANVSTTGWTVGTTTLQDVLDATKDFTNEVNGTLSMNSKVYTATLKVSVDNYLGYSEAPEGGNVVTTTTGDGAQVVKLYRNVAKIVLNGLDTSTSAVNFPNGTLAVKGVFLLHGNKSTKLAAASLWGSTEVTAPLNYLNGYVGDDSYAAWVKVFTDNNKLVPVYNYLTGNNYGAEESYVVEGSTVVGSSFYAYENTNVTTRTLLVVKGDYSYTDVTNQTTVTEYDRYYPVAVGVDNVTNTVVGTGDFMQGDRTSTVGVLRNLQYAINMKITGPGYDTPFGPKPDGGQDPEDPEAGDTFLNVNCQVVDFGAVIQNPGTIE